MEVNLRAVVLDILERINRKAIIKSKARHVSSGF